MTDLRHTRPLSQVEIEDRIQDVIEEMERATEEYETMSKDAAEAEADYKNRFARATLAVIEHSEKMTVGEREARVTIMCKDEHKTYLVTQATRNSRREYLTTIRAHLDALRTLNASVRNQT